MFTNEPGEHYYKCLDCDREFVDDPSISVQTIVYRTENKAAVVVPLDQNIICDHCESSNITVLPEKDSLFYHAYVSKQINSLTYKIKCIMGQLVNSPTLLTEMHKLIFVGEVREPTASTPDHIVRPEPSLYTTSSTSSTSSTEPDYPEEDRSVDRIAGGGYFRSRDQGTTPFTLPARPYYIRVYEKVRSAVAAPSFNNWLCIAALYLSVSSFAFVVIRIMLCIRGK